MNPKSSKSTFDIIYYTIRYYNILLLVVLLLLFNMINTVITTFDLLRYAGTQGCTSMGFAMGFAKLQVTVGILFVAVIKVCESVAEPINGTKVGCIS